MPVAVDNHQEAIGDMGLSFQLTLLTLRVESVPLILCGMEGSRGFVIEGLLTTETNAEGLPVREPLAMGSNLKIPMSYLHIIGHVMWIVPITFLVIGVFIDFIETEGGVIEALKKILICTLVISWPFIIIIILNS